MNRVFPPLLQSIASELNKVLNKLEEILSPLAKSLLQELSPRENDLLVPPGLVLLSASLFNKKERAVLPALFIMLVNIGSLLHNIPARKKGKENQLLILTGDYICGHLFQLLCETDSFPLLERFARLISVMNEGNTILETARQSSRENIQAVMEGLRRKHGVFFGECCALGCLFAGGTEEEQEQLYHFGFEFGIAYGAKKYGMELFKIKTLPCFANNTALEMFAQELISSPVRQRAFT